MKHRGDNAPPNAFTVEEQPKKPGYVLVRFYENVRSFTEIVGDLTMSGYEYDEYYLEMVDHSGLQDDILSNYDALLAQVKLAEAEETLIPSLKEQVAQLQGEKENLEVHVTLLEGQVIDTQLALCDVYELMLGG